MNVVLLVVSVVVTAAAVTIALPSCIEIFHRLRSRRRLSCPETDKQASVALSAGLAATTSAFIPPQLHVKGCTLWPEHRECGRSCLGRFRSTIL